MHSANHDLSIFQKHENFKIRIIREEPLTVGKTGQTDQNSGASKCRVPEKNENTKDILVATSIKPDDIKLQTEAIDTWLKTGFKVVALNTREEAERLKPYFPNIHFHIIERSAKKRYGRSYIYIYDIMRYLSGTDYDIVGIVNSDIYFKGVRRNFVDFIRREAAGSLVYGHRLDVSNLSDNYGTLRNGVDYFFFDKNLIPIYKDDGMCLGQPAWDWWMVCVAAAAHKPTKRLLSKIAFHQIHPKEWYESLNQYLIESVVFRNYLQKLYPGAAKRELNSKMWDIVISKNGIEYEAEDTASPLESPAAEVPETEPEEKQIPAASPNSIKYEAEDTVSSPEPPLAEVPETKPEKLQIPAVSPNGINYEKKAAAPLPELPALKTPKKRLEGTEIPAASPNSIKYEAEDTVSSPEPPLAEVPETKPEKLQIPAVSPNGINYEKKAAAPFLELPASKTPEKRLEGTEIPAVSNRKALKLKPILVATSVSPDRIEAQKRAIKSWLDAGFDVVSLNTEEEADTLKAHFPDIKFHIVKRSAKEKYGKPYIYIYDFMSYLNSTDYKVVGIVNSDVQFRNIRPDFINVIYSEALNSLVYGHRMDVTHISDSSGTLSNGVDYFFFDRDLISVYQDDGLCMGQPAWDWWMVCVPASKNKITKRILNPIGYHEIHPQQWDQELNKHLIDTIVMEKYVKKLYPDVADYYELDRKMWGIVITKNGIAI
ncbi:hypothetical protein OYT88_09475 [Sporolactobacillus sp. CQH2019]|uniref:hypothetical protein n=1 Tax=Sporolactobacillus sp. CQH2019 TaxID=3023512 RepID=UPI00236765EE|nr:hypothetical protein [Sporolactobacillus sp. CQH2019]MDD9148778.1 hypothetical protein [Sporolactobacillus sp. CQH2019]